MKPSCLAQPIAAPLLPFQGFLQCKDEHVLGFGFGYALRESPKASYYEKGLFPKPIRDWTRLVLKMRLVHDEMFLAVFVSK